MLFLRQFRGINSTASSLRHVALLLDHHIDGGIPPSEDVTISEQPFLCLRSKTQYWEREEGMMRKSLVASIHVLLIVLMVAPIAVANSYESCKKTESGVSLLQQLYSDILMLPNEAFENMRRADAEKNALCNKINAVMNQVEAGDYEGALNKLRNDVEKAVTKWIAGRWRDHLLDLIECIIRVIKGRCHVDRTPPVIHEVVRYPSAPEYDDSVLVLAYVTDCQSGVANVTLSYSTNLGESVNLTMREVDGLHEAEIPPHPYNVNVTFFVYAWDRAGNVAVSPKDSYVVGDFHPPVISYIERVPASPNYNETVLVFVNATEPSSASGVREVILTYNNGTVWTNVTMSLQNGLYVATIPKLPYGTVVQYRVYAFDNAGNWAAMDVYSYTVQDRFLPVATIDAPTRGSYLSGFVNVTVYVYDDNFSGAKLTVNGTVLISWSEAGLHTYLWNTTASSDGVYGLMLDAYDEAGNIGEAECQVIVDNTAPTLEIERPLNGSYVRGTVLVEVSAEDSNFDEMELTVGGSVHVWKAGGSQIYVWETADYADGFYVIVLSARDKAGNEAETSVSVTVDNTAPSLKNLAWSPSEPGAGEQVNVSVQVFEEGSGIRNVTLWFRVNFSEWEFLNMNFQAGNWTCTIPGQGEKSTVEFYVESYDNAGNFAATLEKEYTVKAAGAVSGFPLVWLLLIIGIIGLVSGAAVYYLKFRKKRP
jgi:hypothetical protein